MVYEILTIGSPKAADLKMRPVSSDSTRKNTLNNVGTTQKSDAESFFFGPIQQRANDVASR